MIQLALHESPQQVFCPSGLRCIIEGSQSPWSFMQAEIECILKYSNSDIENEKKHDFVYM